MLSLLETLPFLTILGYSTLILTTLEMTLEDMVYGSTVSTNAKILVEQYSTVLESFTEWLTIIAGGFAKDILVISIFIT